VSLGWALRSLLRDHSSLFCVCVCVPLSPRQCLSVCSEACQLLAPAPALAAMCLLFSRASALALVLACACACALLPPHGVSPLCWRWRSCCCPPLPKRRRVSEALEVGICWVNCSQPCFCQAPWGGVKDSGFGRELGTFGLDSFLSVKQVCDSAVHWGEGGDGLGLGTQAP
jgi:hypothetical protein